MAWNQLSFAKGESINRPPLFCGLNFSFWKVRMNNFMESVNRGIWQAMVNDYAIPTQVVDNKTIEKSFEFWTIKEIRREEYDSKAMNIIYSSLICDQFFKVFACITAKEMWDLIQVRNSRSEEIKEELSYPRI